MTLTLGHRLPDVLSIPLFGDRKRYGVSAPHEDLEWQRWQRVKVDFYERSQRKGIGKWVNDAGYGVMRRVDLRDRRVLEVGPGDLGHARNWKGSPSHFTLVDVEPRFLKISGAFLAQQKIPHTECLVAPGECCLPAAEHSVDTVISFYSLEHLHPLDAFVQDIHRVLKPGGLLVGAIPSEGGLAWGIGRYLTTRRWLRKQHNLNLDKIICWEHVNFADEILGVLDNRLRRTHLSYWPMGISSIDLNLVIRFVYKKA